MLTTLCWASYAEHLMLSILCWASYAEHLMVSVVIQGIIWFSVLRRVWILSMCFDASQHKFYPVKMNAVMLSVVSPNVVALPVGDFQCHREIWWQILRKVYSKYHCWTNFSTPGATELMLSTFLCSVAKRSSLKLTSWLKITLLLMLCSI